MPGSQLKYFMSFIILVSDTHTHRSANINNDYIGNYGHILENALGENNLVENLLVV